MIQRQPRVWPATAPNFRTLLDTFNDRWVAAAEFSPELLVVLLAAVDDWTSGYYAGIDPDSGGEPVGFFGHRGSTSPIWKAIAQQAADIVTRGRTSAEISKLATGPKKRPKYSLPSQDATGPDWLVTPPHRGEPPGPRVTESS